MNVFNLFEPKQKKVKIKESRQSFHNGDQVELTPSYAQKPGEVFTVSQCDQERGRCWIGDQDGRGWYATFDQLIPATSEEYDEDSNAYMGIDSVDSTSPIHGVGEAATAPSNSADGYYKMIAYKLKTDPRMVSEKEKQELHRFIMQKKLAALEEHIGQVKDGYRLYSHKGKNLGTFPTKAGAEKHEREVQYFKHKESIGEARGGNYEQMNYRKSTADKFVLLDRFLDAVILTTNNIKEAKKEAIEWAEYDDIACEVIHQPSGRSVFFVDGAAGAEEYMEEGTVYDLEKEYGYEKPKSQPRRSTPSDYPYSREEDDDYFREIFRKKREVATKDQGVAEGFLNEFAPNAGGEGGNYLKALASAWYNHDIDMLKDIIKQGGNALNRIIDAQEAVEKILARGIHCGDGKVRKYMIGYNHRFDGVDIQSDDHYEYADYDDAGRDVDSRTGKPWGPYDVVEFGGNELDESIQQGVAEGHADQVKKIVKKNGKPVGEIGTDPEASPGNGNWYVKHYASGYDVVGFDNAEEALEELKHCLKQGVAETARMSAAMKLQRAFQREQEKSAASRERAKQLLNPGIDRNKQPEPTGVKKKNEFDINKPVTELSKGTLGNYVRANANDQVQHASHQSFKSGKNNDKYNTADAWDQRTTKREKGMDRALNKLTKENLDEAIESRLYAMKQAGYDIL